MQDEVQRDSYTALQSLSSVTVIDHKVGLENFTPTLANKCPSLELVRTQWNKYLPTLLAGEISGNSDQFYCPLRWPNRKMIIDVEKQIHVRFIA